MSEIQITFEQATYSVKNSENEMITASIGKNKKISLVGKFGQDFIFKNSDPGRVSRMGEMFMKVAKFAMDMKEVE